MNAYRLPFFFEPNFDALIKPLAGAIQEQEQRGEQVDESLYSSVVYGEFLKKKVGSNFAEATPGKGRYD